MSTIPTRRAINRNTSTRNTINENANATRHLRVSSRVKALDGTHTDGASAITTTTGAAATVAGVVTRKMGALLGVGGGARPNHAAASEKHPVGKRKREALVEVTAVSNNKNRKSREQENKGVGSGKGKAKEDVAAAVGGTKTLKPNVTGLKAKESETKVVLPTIPAATKVFRKPTRESLRAISGATAHRPTRSTSVSTNASAASTQVTKHKRGTSFVLDSSRPPVFVRKPSLKAELNVDDDVALGKNDEDDEPMEEEDIRASKRRHFETASLDGPIPVSLNDESQAEADRIAEELVQLVDHHEPVPVQVEPKEEVRLWDDLDAEDWDDPAMVSEYVVDVCKYLKEIEIQTLPDADYMSNHPELDWEKRGILVDWILQVHARFNLLQETLFLFTNILDRFLSSRPVSLSKLQLVGITAFFIASKYEETYAPSVSDIAYLADGQYTVEEILKAERYILKTLDWNLRYPGPMGWLRRGSKADNCEIKARIVGKYLIEIGCLDWRLVGTLPSLLAAAALWLARLVLGREAWTPNMEHYMTYSEAELLPTANIMLNYILEPIQHESLYKKYAHKRYLKCSAFMRYWALDRWPESTVVSLERDLQALKEDIRAEREAKSGGEMVDIDV